ncbi:MAG: hypothetical protein LBS64_04060 [Spirochaetaceae bacterium]|jgi:hypothetical protein|nr:hypothetical protein [Spirochaetaceae bacterium]
MKNRVVVLCLLCALATPVTLSALVNPRLIPPGPPSEQVRERCVQTWLAAPLTELRGRKPESLQNQRGDFFQVRMEEDREVFHIAVIPQSKIEMDVYSTYEADTRLYDIYAVGVPGTWVFTRDAATGTMTAITCYFAGDDQVFLRFFPGADHKTTGELVVFGAHAARNVHIPVNFNRLYTATMTDLKNWAPQLPWHYFSFDSSRYSGVRQMVAVIQKNLPRVKPAVDSVPDENGTLVPLFAGTPGVVPAAPASGEIALSNSGFVKWIADGLAEPLTGSGIKVTALLTRSEFRYLSRITEKLAGIYDLAFSLDWTRHLAAAIASAKTRRVVLPENSGCDVTVEPFVSSNRTLYLPHAGYHASALEPLLYVLALTEPDIFYLAAVREVDRSTTPEVGYFNSSAAVFSLFDEVGHFTGLVFEDGVEYTLRDFIEKYGEDHIFLSRVRASEYFFLR